MSFLENMATSAIGAIGNFFTGGASARKQYQYQSKLMDKQNQQQIDFWKMNNEYNTPFNQRARLEQAGLNPDLMYGGSGNMYQSQMPGAASGSAPNVDYGSFSDNLRFAMQAQVMDAQVSKIEMENKLLAEQALSQASLRDLQSSQAADALARAEHQGIYNKHADTRYFLENEARGLKNTLLGADVNSYETRLRLDQQRVANDNMRAKVQVLQLGLNEKKLKADMEKIRAEVAEIMSRVKVNNAQQRKLVADAIETEALNHYYYKNGMIPTSNTMGWIANSIVNSITDYIDPFNPEE
jgi:DNA polymerase III epsilon subunit-like protein